MTGVDRCSNVRYNNLPPHPVELGASELVLRLRQRRELEVRLTLDASLCLLLMIVAVVTLISIVIFLSSHMATVASPSDMVGHHDPGRILLQVVQAGRVDLVDPDHRIDHHPFQLVVCCPYNSPVLDHVAYV